MFQSTLSRLGALPLLVCTGLISTDLSAQCEAVGGSIEFSDGNRIATFTEGEAGSTATVVLGGDQVGAQGAWAITDQEANILYLEEGPTFDFSDKPADDYLIWYASYEGEIEGLEVGGNGLMVEGCFSPSNPVVVQVVDPSAISAGTIAFPDGSSETDVCLDGVDDEVNVEITDPGNPGEQTGWVISDENAIILGLPAAPPFNFEGAGEGTCLIWRITYTGELTGVEIGRSAARIRGEFDLANPLTVKRAKVGADAISFADGSGEATIVIDSVPDPLDVSLDGTGQGESSGWVITDTDLNILGLPAAPPFDLNGAGTGTCLIWSINYNGELVGAEVGNNAADLEGCFELSNPLTVYRVSPDEPEPTTVVTGNISLPDGSQTAYVCPGEGNSEPISVTKDYSTPVGKVAYVVTDEDFNIIAFPTSNSVDFSGAGVGICYIFTFNYTGNIMSQLGDLVYTTRFSDDTYLISNNGVKVIRNEADGGSVTALSGASSAYVCIGDTASGIVAFKSDSTSGANFTYVITDDENNILATTTTSYLDFSGAGVGVCRVWGLSYTGEITAGAGDNAATTELSSGCFDLSDNFLSIVRTTPDGGTVSSGGEEQVSATGVESTVDLETTGVSTAAYAYFVLDNTGTIIDATLGSSVDLAGYADGQYYIYGVSHTGTVLLNVGDNFYGSQVTDGCFEQSSNAVVVTYREMPAARKAGEFQANVFAERTLQIRTLEQTDAATGQPVAQAKNAEFAGPTNLRVHDSYGSLVAAKDNLSPEALRQFELELSEARPGVHFVTLIRGGATSTRTVVLP